MRKARAEFLVAGDIVAIYAGNDTPSHSAVIEEIRSDEFTPAHDPFTSVPTRHLTFWTTLGRFDIPENSVVDVLAWAPMPEIPERLLP